MGLLCTFAVKRGVWVVACARHECAHLFRAHADLRAGARSAGRSTF